MLERLVEHRSCARLLAGPAQRHPELEQRLRLRGSIERQSSGVLEERPGSGEVVTCERAASR